MFNHSEDPFLNTFADKVGSAKVQEPKLEDWASFQEAYQAHKNAGKRRKRALILWFTLGLFTLLGFFFLLYSKPYTMGSEPKESLGQQKKMTNTPAKKNQTKSLANSPGGIRLNAIKGNTEPILQSENKKTPWKQKRAKWTVPVYSQSTSQVSDVRATPPLQPGVDANVKSINLAQHKPILPLSTGKLNVQSPGHLALLPILPGMREEENLSEQIKSKDMSAPIAGGAFLGIAYNLQNNPYQNNRLTDKPLQGIALFAGKGIGRHWSLQSGLNMGFSFQNSSGSEWVHQTEKQILRIDTSIKYSVVYNRLMMQIDTLSEMVDRSHENTYTRQQQNILISLPLLLRYHIGNERSSFFAMAGIQAGLYTQTTTSHYNNGSGETWQLKNTGYKTLIGPSIGLGASRRIMGPWHAFGSAHYTQFMGTSLLQPTNFQIQCGIFYTF